MFKKKRFRNLEGKTYCGTEGCGSTPVNFDKIVLDEKISKYNMHNLYNNNQTFLIDKSGAKYTLSRTFAIIPEHNKNDRYDKYLQYSRISKIFNKFNSYKNLYTQWLIQFYLNDEETRLDYFKSNSIKSAGYLFNEFNLSKFKATSYYKSKNPENNFKLHNRLKASAYYSAYISVRAWIKRRAYLREVINVLIDKFNRDIDFSIQFLSGKRFRYGELQDFFPYLSTDCFGKESDITVNYLNNMLGQIRNIFFNNFDFTSQDDGCSFNFIIETFKSLKNISFESISKIARSFTKKENRELTFINENELCSHILDLFFRKVSKITTKQYKKKSFDTLSNFLGNININNFKKERNFLFAHLKSNYSKRITINDVYNLIIDVWNWFLDDFFEDENHYIIKKIFTPPHMRNFIQDISFNDFLKFFKYKIFYQIRKLFKSFFLKDDFSNQLFGYALEKLNYIYNNIDDFLKIPIHKGFSMPIITKKIWSFEKKEGNEFKEINWEKDDISKIRLFLRVSFIPHNPIYFRFIDKNHRFLNLLEKGFTFHNPTLIFKDRKILLSLPFQKEKGHESTTQMTSTGNDAQLGADLGLIDFAVLNVKEKGRIIKRYFLGSNELFNKKFDRITGNLVYQDKCFDEYGCFIPRRLANIKLKLINIRKQIQIHQRLKNEYENRLIEKGITNFRSKLKWNKLRRTISALWRKVNNINSQIARYVGHFIYEIARYHHVNIVKFEDLRWSTHSKKRDRGKFIAKWQAHWLFSQMQTATADRCRSLGIKVGIVDAEYTSQICSRCGELGNRVGKKFSCQYCGFKPDSDLNASYNVVDREIISYI